MRDGGGAPATLDGRHAQVPLRVRVAAPPSEGRANKELLSFLAGNIGVPVSCVVLVRGAASRHKVVAIDGISTEEALKRLLSA